MQESGATRTSQATISAALAAANAVARANLGFDPLGSDVRFTGENRGHSVAEMAYRDLDATLQLLADRAQYITGSTGAAIALRRLGKNDMLCRASAGVNAPELGALLSTEFGLSGESVRTRQALRCDDAERDARVNREVCRQMGIASVVVMPVVHDDEVLGVFELFSGRVNAFGERDLSALQRLSGMVETAIELAHAAVSAPERFKTAAPAVETAALENSPTAGVDSILEDDTILEVDGFDVVAAPSPQDQAPEVRVEARISPSGVDAPVLNVPALDAPLAGARVLPAALQDSVLSGAAEPIAASSVPAGLEPAVAAVSQFEVPSPAKPAAARKPIFWSAAGPATGEREPLEADQSHVPVGLRNLRKCEACGFPVSAGRALCVECEEKKWRGQLRRPPLTVTQAAASAPDVAQKTPLQSSAAAATAVGTSARPAAPDPSGTSAPGMTGQGVLSGTLAGLTVPPVEGSSPRADRAFAATAQAAGAAPGGFSPGSSSPSEPVLSAGAAVAGTAVSPGSISSGIARPATETKDVSESIAAGHGADIMTEAISKPVSTLESVSSATSKSPADLLTISPDLGATVAEYSPQPLPAAAPELVLSAGLAPAQSWFGANKYILAVLLVVGAAVAAVLLR